ncbi:hypothetical protein FHW58_003767 [Duganella sp. 1224]|uniref:BPSL0067 family protein n=1 Tax=Duganella sp. 1224 TaxID=2587052 RepID=UPI0015CED934|nr:BPSL0067 family protein [Duganella sp. 1224]NYE62548.1 hypothetical protein [Duganella sp. 1224]
MPYIYPQAATLERQPKVGTGDCVELVRYYADVPDHRIWTAGARVLDNKNVAPGTAIATFVHGRYPNNDKGNHAAFFLRHGAPGDGFWVIDQWKDGNGRGKKPRISARYIKSLHMKLRPDGSFPRASDNADAFYVIEHR